MTIIHKEFGCIVCNTSTGTTKEWQVDFFVSEIKNIVLDMRSQTGLISGHCRSCGTTIEAFNPHSQKTSLYQSLSCFLFIIFPLLFDFKKYSFPAFFTAIVV